MGSKRPPSGLSYKQCPATDTPARGHPDPEDGAACEHFFPIKNKRIENPVWSLHTIVITKTLPLFDPSFGLTHFAMQSFFYPLKSQIIQNPISSQETSVRIENPHLFAPSFDLTHFAIRPFWGEGVPQRVFYPATGPCLPPFREA